MLLQSMCSVRLNVFDLTLGTTSVNTEVSAAVAD